METNQLMNAKQYIVIVNNGIKTIVDIEKISEYLVKAGDKLKIVKNINGENQEIDNFVAIKNGQALEIRFENGETLSLNNFYSFNDSEIEFSPSDGSTYTLSSMSEFGFELSDHSSLVYAQGKESILFDIAKGNESLQTALFDQISIANAETVADAAAGATGADAAAGATGAAAGLSTAAMVGIGAVVVGGAIALGGGSSGGGSSAPAAAPTIEAPTINTVSTDDLINATEEGTGFDLTGTGEVGATVTVTGFTGADKTALVDVDGNWIITVSSGDLIADAANVLSATQTDADANTSAAATTTITVDVTALAPTIDTVSDDNHIYLAEEAAGFELTGTAEAGATVTVTGFTGADKTAVADSSGNWSVSVVSGDLLPNNANVISATQTDVAGNTSAVGTTEISVGSLPPPTIYPVSTDNVINAAEEAGFNLTGTGEVGATVTLSGATLAGGNTTVVNIGGGWVLAVATGDLVADSANALSVNQTLAGNVSPSATTTITVDVTIPLAPTFDAVSVDNRVNAVEDDTGFVMTGTGEVGATVTVTPFLTGEETAVVDDSGNWSITLPGTALTAVGANVISATQTDIAGNTSAAATTTIILDATPPGVPAIDTVSDDDLINGTEETAGFNLTGTGEEDATVTVTGFTTADKTAVVVGGVWSVTVDAGDLPLEGANTLSATQTDVAGNPGPARTTTITVDTTAPVITNITNNVVDTTHILSFTVNEEISEDWGNSSFIELQDVSNGLATIVPDRVSTTNGIDYTAVFGNAAIEDFYYSINVSDLVGNFGRAKGDNIGTSEELVLESNSTQTFDGGDGYDWVALGADNTNDDIGTLVANTNITNIEEFDLSGVEAGDTLHAVTNISLADVISLTDADNDLIFWSELPAGDTVEIDLSVWVQDGTNPNQYNGIADANVNIILDNVTAVTI